MKDASLPGQIIKFGSFQNIWIDGARPRPDASTRLFCFPFAGGGALAYRTWSKVLSPDIELCPIQLPGRERRFDEKAQDSCSPLVEEIVGGIRGMLDKPFMIFGHSMGGVLAFEFIRALRRKQVPMPRVFGVSAAFAPHRYTPPAILRHSLPKSELLKEIQRWGGTAPEVLAHSELMDMLLPTLRADLVMIENYQYHVEAPLDVPILAFGGREDPEVSGKDLKAWAEQSQKSFDHQEFPGDHFYLDSAIPEILESMQGRLLLAS